MLVKTALNQIDYIYNINRNEKISNRVQRKTIGIRSIKKIQTREKKLLGMLPPRITTPKETS